MENTETQAKNAKSAPGTPVRKQAADPKNADAMRTQPRKTIVVASTGQPNEENPVYVGVNGYRFLIERGKPVEVPIAVLEVLDNAIETKYDQVKDETGKTIDLRPRDSQKYPYRVVQ